MFCSIIGQTRSTLMLNERSQIVICIIISYHSNFGRSLPACRYLSTDLTMKSYSESDNCEVATFKLGVLWILSLKCVWIRSWKFREWLTWCPRELPGRWKRESSLLFERHQHPNRRRRFLEDAEGFSCLVKTIVKDWKPWSPWKVSFQ